MAKQAWKRTTAMAVAAALTSALSAGGAEASPATAIQATEPAEQPATRRCPVQPPIELAGGYGQSRSNVTVFGAQSIDMKDDGYNSSYMFGMTRGVSGSSLHPGVKPLFFLVTIPLDIVLLPFAAIGGFF